jgi:hypothetical protein
MREVKRGKRQLIFQRGLVVSALDLHETVTVHEPNDARVGCTILAEAVDRSHSANEKKRGA